jgi:SPFH domain / Band 7 family
MKNLKLKSVLRTLAALVVLGIILGVFQYSRTQWIPAGYVGVIYDASEGVLPQVYKPQALVVGWRQQLHIYPTRLQAAVYTQDPNAGEVRAADGILITTNDNANTVFDVTVFYRVKTEDVLRAFNAFGAVPIEEVQSTYIRRAVKEVANSVGTQYDLFSLMGPKRKEASQKLTADLRSKLSGNGITIEAALLGACYPSQDIQQKITSRVNAYVELEISRLQRQIAEINRQVAVVQGEANAQATKISSSQTKDRSLELLKIQAESEAISRWNGALPPINPRPGQSIIISPDAVHSLGGSR